MAYSNPFAPSTSHPGRGEIDLALLPPSTPVLKTLSYQYPLKLIAPEPINIQGTASSNKDAQTSVQTVFLLTYGGGLVAGDTIDLHIKLAPTTRLVLLTQGSTKIFKAPSSASEHRAGQTTTVDLAPGAALCYLPDPVQPFSESSFTQIQRYRLAIDSSAEGSANQPAASLCALDWVSEGRGARGEHWGFWSYVSRNEVYLTPSSSASQDNAPARPKAKDRLLVRDNIMLHNGVEGGSVTTAGDVLGRMDGLAAVGTLVLCGPVFVALGAFFMDEFAALPRIGAKTWSSGAAAAAPEDSQSELSKQEIWRADRLRQEADDGVLWTAANVRGSVLVKVGAKTVEGARSWLGRMIKREGSVEREFGEGALLCLK
ncbi:UreD urease accessory protein-domain-containing protein [Phyllosticta citribraziliensis]|uniref:UreD urease accessory protein-domain-containing protein n=1 Tax=Phyllosticta citribraziliensis TaxID=989973 RepID=A0ABR1MDA9_9PEZI